MAPSSEPGGPLTPAMLTTINALAAQERRIYRRWTIIFAVLMVFWAVLFTVVLHSALMTFSVICAFFMLLFLIVGQIANRAAQRRMLDIAFVRTTGPIEVVPYQTRSAGAEGRSDRQLAHPHAGARQQQAGHIGAADQQHHADDA